ncbi:hypothetical protein CORC01_11902 [Colletotrichum orchidophilum]|uniref:Uncharacterized protein n=1 Tax=Colletotrichum orchidophilum TaxID=1209926 RepID=A0A1G4AUK4_9PEZI|nr:uncharacterized protein CORC01_11902 [Colletotrichum orchidophilum]OHE92824.1 hypothetical protein CORC01_11902 [Colletotrichum orchidophilum]
MQFQDHCQVETIPCELSSRTFFNVVACNGKHPIANWNAAKVQPSFHHSFFPILKTAGVLSPVSPSRRLKCLTDPVRSQWIANQIAFSEPGFCMWGRPPASTLQLATPRLRWSQNHTFFRAFAVQPGVETADARDKIGL